MNERRGKSRIRKSTDADLRTIHTWLVAQKARNVPGTFLCNWELTKKAHKEGKLFVYIDGASEQPVAYQWGDLGILEVRHDMRGKGIGRKLVERRIKQAAKNNECFLHIQCEPSSSIPFWKRMGFILLDSKNEDQYAYRLLEKKHQLPPDGVPVEVAIRFFPEERKYNEKISAYSVATPDAVKTSDGVIHLAKRVAFFSQRRPDCHDPVVEIEVAGKVLICDKAKYPEARALGVLRCDDGFYLDIVRC
jgi:GNAT superfamily N-acetyltransferase